MTSQIENFFVEVEILIELQLRNKLQNQLKNQLEVKQKFKVGKRLIDELLDEDDVKLFEPFRLFRYKYHIKYATYLEAIGEIDNANREKDYAKNYEKNEENFKEVGICKKTEPVSFAGATLGNINQASYSEENSKKNSMQDSVEKHLKVIQNILEDKITEDIRQVFEQFDEIPETLEDYQKMVNSEIGLLKILNNFINDMSISKDNDQILGSLESLKKLAIGASYSRRILFIQFVLNSPNRKEILYSNISSTEGIRKRFRELDQYFHQPYQLLSKDKNLGDELFEFIQEYKEILLSELESASKNEGDLTFHEKKANELWKITIDYRNAAKGQWDKLRLLNKEDVKNYKRDELEHHSMTHGILACQEYQAACKIVDEARQLKKQAKLRGNMALCLCVSNNFFEAQLYALSAIVLLMKNSHEIIQQDLIEAKKIFDEVKGGNGTEETAEIDLKDNSDNTPALMKVMDQSSINDDLAKLSTELIFSPSRSLIRYQASTEKHALTCKASEVAIGGGISIESAISIAIVGTSSILFMGGIATLALGICSGIKLWKVHTAVLSKEKEIREKLNQVMINALDAYDKGEHQKFLDALSEEYTTNTSLLKLGKCDDFINPEDIIDKLLAHGFRSDAIAYLLNLFGEVLNDGKLKIEGMTSYKLKALARYVFNAVLSERLKVEAKKLDDRICELRIKHQKNSFTQVKDLKEYMDDAQEMSFQSRLEEMCNIARINLAIVDLVHGGYDQIERAVETIKEFRNLINSNHQFIKWRLEVLDDLLWVIRC